MEGSHLQDAEFLEVLEQARTQKGRPFMRRGEVEKHNKPNDTYIIVNEVVFDVCFTRTSAALTLLCCSSMR